MRSLFSILLTILTIYQGLAQDSSKVSQDSTTNAQLIATTRLLRESDSLIRADAATKAALEEQILQLSNNNQRKKELEQQLALIEQADSLKKVRHFSVSFSPSDRRPLSPMW
nr:hypothetical protein [uncultured Chitinophaga sp.]